MQRQGRFLGFHIHLESRLSSSSVRAGHLFFSTWSLPLLQSGLGKPSLSVCPDEDLDRNGSLSESAYFILFLAAAGDGCINGRDL